MVANTRPVEVGESRIGYAVGRYGVFHDHPPLCDDTKEQPSAPRTARRLALTRQDAAEALRACFESRCYGCRRRNMRRIIAM